MPILTLSFMVLSSPSRVFALALSFSLSRGKDFADDSQGQWPPGCATGSLAGVLCHY